jgi:Capsule assembly protein Wzi
MSMRWRGFARRWSGCTSLQRWLGASTRRAIPPSMPAWPCARNQASLQLQAASDNVALRLRLGVQEQRLSRSPTRETLYGSYAALRLPGAVLSLGAVDRWWGPARYASPVLGNAAAPIPTLTLRRASEAPAQAPALAWIGPWHYEISVGRPSHYRPAGPATIGMRLSARPWPGLELGLVRYLYWGGEGRPRNWASLRDALIGRSNIDDPALQGPDPSNELAGVDVRWSQPSANGSWAVYAHMVGEDESNAVPSKWIGTLGLQLKHATPSHRLHWTAEATDTRLGHLFGLRPSNRDPAYRHSTYRDGHYHQGLPNAAFIGGGGMVASVGVAVVPVASPSALRYEARLWSARVNQNGSEPINAAYGQPGRIDGLLLQGAGVTRGLRWHLGLAVQHPAGGLPSARRSLGLIGGVEAPFNLP